MQLWANGFSVLYEPRAVIRHYESASSGASESARVLMNLQGSKFVSKWRDLLEAHLPPLSGNIPRARFARHAHEKHVLYIDDRVPHGNLGSGYPRSCEIVRCLIEMGYTVTVATFLFNLGDDEYTDIPRDVEFVDGVSERDRMFREYVPFADVVWISRPHNYASFIDASVQLWTSEGKGALIYDAEVIASQRDQLQTRIEGHRVPEAILEARVKRELSLAGAADALVAVSDRDAEVMRAAGLSNIHVLGHCVEAEPTSASFEERSCFACIGAMHGVHNPNADAIRYFCSEVWPFVRARTGADLLVAGYGSSDILGDLKGEGVRIVGFVDDLRAFYNSVRVIVIPTRYSGGIPLKAYEAAAYGVPMVVSKLIGEQLGWSGQKECLVADSPMAYAEACKTLYTDPVSWRLVRDAALQYVQSGLSRTRFKEQIADIVRSVCGPCNTESQ
jgi:glycosyltransferase involved in cell wall biosynthesis